MTAGTAIQASLTIPGLPDQVRVARAFTANTLGDDHPCTTAAVLLVSELVTNSILHSYSRLPGGTITITVTSIQGGVRVEVRDAGSVSVPVLKDSADALAVGGRGLQLVRNLAARCGYRRDEDGLVAWFEIGTGVCS